MKRLLTLLFSALLGLQAGTLHLRGNFDRALEEARSQNKMLLVLLTRPRDPDTTTMLGVLRQEDIGEWLEKNAVTVIVVTGQQNYPVELLYTTSLPAFFLLSPEEVLLAGPLGEGTDAELFRKELTDKFPL